MGRKIELTINEKTYTLEFNRRTLLKCVDLQKEQASAKTMSEQYSLFSQIVKLALEKNHPEISEDELETIIDSIGLDNLKEFGKALNQIIESSVNTLGNKGNAQWVVK